MEEFNNQNRIYKIYLNLYWKIYLHIHHNSERHKDRVQENLLSEIGELKRRQRTADVDPVFAHIKTNQNFKRFTHIGIEKAELEFGLYALSHNLRKKNA